jgi:hypothetical protein
MTFQIVQFGLPSLGYLRFESAWNVPRFVTPICGYSAQRLSANNRPEAKRDMRNLWTEGGGLTA